MSLSLSFEIGRSALSTSADRTSVVTRNVARADDPDATRKSVAAVTLYGGGVQAGEAQRATDSVLFDGLLSSNSRLGAQAAVKAGLDQYSTAIGDASQERSPAALLGKLQNSLQLLSVAPHDTASAEAVVNVGLDLANQLNVLSSTISDIRQTADADISRSVLSMNTLLAEFDEVNTSIVIGTHSGDDVTDQLDRRDAILKELSSEVEIRSIVRENNDMVVFASGGLTLFERSPRSVGFESTPVLPAGSTGSSMFVDGIALDAADAAGNVKGGRIAGLLYLRDTVAPALQKQLDEVARNLVQVFAESDQGAVLTLADQPGLFTFAGATGVPPANTIVDGLASQILVNPNVIPSEGGDLGLLRDGGISDPLNAAYSYNLAGHTGFNGRINELIGGLNSAVGFDPAAGLGETGDLVSFAADSEAWLQELRSNTTRVYEYEAVFSERAVEALSSATGINIDEEMIELLDLERSYQASSRLLQVLDDMFNSLFAATR